MNTLEEVRAFSFKWDDDDKNIGCHAGITRVLNSLPKRALWQPNQELDGK